MDRPQLDIPLSLTDRWEAVSAHTRNPFRGLMACLQLCWLAGPDAASAPQVDPADHDYDMVKVGTMVGDELLRRGWRFNDLAELGREAFKVAVTDLVSAEDMQAAEGNSAAGAEQSTSSPSRSKSGGDSAPANCDDSPGTSKPS
jgi:hypothetical protein